MSYKRKWEILNSHAAQILETEYEHTNTNKVAANREQ